MGVIIYTSKLISNNPNAVMALSIATASFRPAENAAERLELRWAATVSKKCYGVPQHWVVGTPQGALRMW